MSILECGPRGHCGDWKKTSLCDTAVYVEVLNMSHFRKGSANPGVSEEILCSGQLGVTIESVHWHMLGVTVESGL